VFPAPTGNPLAEILESNVLPNRMWIAGAHC
jgi:hypothetical protein